MIKKTRDIVLCLLVLGCTRVFSQSDTLANDTLNRLNAKGYYEGYWKYYYNDRLERTYDTASAVYYGYEYHVNGYASVGVPDKLASDKVTFKSPPQQGKGPPFLVEGVFRFYDKHGILSFEEVYKNGIASLVKYYQYFNDGTVYGIKISNFGKTYNNLKGSYYYEVHDYSFMKETWKIKKYWYYPEGKKMIKKAIGTD